MLSNMPKSVFNGLAVLTVAIPVLAWSNLLPVHNVRASALQGFEEVDRVLPQYTSHVMASSHATFSWQEGTLQSFGNVQVKTKADTFELKLVRTTSTNSYEVAGEWDVFKNGNPTCAGCKGSVYVSPVGAGGEYFKGYVENDKVAYSFYGDLDANTRYDY
ncbi:hypothetical protein ATI61_114107 [Archangium gephyra]|uniref:Uncharacterized protein n=1 Tax=Archangium gephyra TaxID=48 RepID=A0AAC8Q577_9BACT|nr:hypothetical protein [Archangium gephyra]AKJ01184.1 Hypothetical protein AA314_02810 [Archangium gephyra]REG24499.1 hypothetical protein ATI61_114107 [Archangium gephyra]